MLYQAVDSFLAIFIVSPLVVGYWRGTWQLLDIYLLSDDDEMSGWTSLVIGSVTLSFLYFCQYHLQRWVDTCKNCIFIVLLTRTYTLIISFCCVNHWRGVWMLFNVYVGSHWISSVCQILVGIVILGLFSSIKTIAAPPMLLVTDTLVNYFCAPTIYKIGLKNGKLTGLFFLDCLFSVVVIGSASVFIWRGTWFIMDVLLYPNNAYKSCLGSLIMGGSIMVCMYLLQPLMSWVSKKMYKKKGLRIGFDVVVTCISFIGTINIWRGVWNSADLYLLTENFTASNWVTHIGIYILMLMNAGNTVPVKGVGYDGDYCPNKGIYYEVTYCQNCYKCLPNNQKLTMEEKEEDVDEYDSEHEGITYV